MTLTLTQLLILIGFSSILFSAMCVGFLILGVTIYRYGQIEAVSFEEFIGGELISAEEFEDDEFSKFLEKAQDHPELYIDGKKIDNPNTGLIFIDFSKTSFKRINPNEEDKGGEFV